MSSTVGEVARRPPGPLGRATLTAYALMRSPGASVTDLARLRGEKARHVRRDLDALKDAGLLKDGRLTVDLAEFERAVRHEEEPRTRVWLQRHLERTAQWCEEARRLGRLGVAEFRSQLGRLTARRDRALRMLADLQAGVPSWELMA